MTLIFKRFELDDLIPNSSILIIGSQNNNKSKIVKDIIIHCEKNCLVIGNDKSYFYDVKRLKNYVKYQEGCNGKVIDQYFNSQKNEKKSSSSYIKSCCWSLLSYCCLRGSDIDEDDEDSENENNDMLVLDDCLEDHPASKNTDILTETKSGLIMTFSSINHCFLDPRYSIYYDYIFLLSDTYEDQLDEELEEKLETVYEKYCSMIPDYRIFRSTFLEIGRDECAMVIARDGTEDLTTKIFWYPITNIKKEQ